MSSPAPMRLPPLPWTGGCRCDRVRFEIGATPLVTTACHCTGCQRMTASAFSLTIVTPSAGFRVTIGETVIGGLHGIPKHHFCAYCMSWMFTRIDRMDTFVNVRATLLDDPKWFVPFMETYTSEKLSWVATPAVRSFEKFPAMEEYPRLIAEFAAHVRSGRPAPP